MVRPYSTFYSFNTNYPSQLINVLVLNIWHPTRFLPKSDKIFLNENNQEEESERGGWEDKRPFLVTLIDPFDIRGLIRNRSLNAEKSAKEKSDDV
jgi:hypothetical protein